MNRPHALWKRVPAPAIDAFWVAVAALDTWVNLWDKSRLGVAMAVIGCVALFFRRRFPLLVFLLALPIALSQDVGVAPIVALFTLAERSRNRMLLAACVAMTAAASSLVWPQDQFPESGEAMTLVAFVYNLATAVAPVLFGQLVQARRDLAWRLEEIEEAREHERALHAQTVLARERAQLAREMHDVVSHQVSLIAVQAGALQVAVKDPQVKDAVRTIRALSVTTLDELRTMVTLLRASGGRATELTPQPTLADLRKLVETGGIRAQLTGDLPSTVGTPVQRALYRTVQEALTNVRKHAPGAAAHVELWQDGDVIGVTVTNTAPTRPSLPLPGSQQGLVGLRERAEILHGTLEAGPTADGGYQVRLTVPLTTD